MKKLLLVVVLGLAGYAGYSRFTAGADPFRGLRSLVGPDLPTRDARGRELVPCPRCLASGLITCSAPQCKAGQVPCPGRCLKPTDAGWKRLEGGDPGKRHMLFYLVDDGVATVSEDHAGEVFEVRKGKLLRLGACPICKKRTTIACKSCRGSGRTTCPVCGGRRTVVKTTASAAPRSTGGS